MMSRDPDDVHPGAMRHRLHVQQISAGATVQNAAGETVPSWTTLTTLPISAEIEFGGGDEILIAGETSTLSYGRLRHRYYAALTTAMRYLWVQPGINSTPVILEIKSIVPGPRRIGQLVTFVQRVGDS